MKTDFTVLWIDDNKDFVESLRPQLERWMDEQGFGLIVRWHPGEAGIVADLKSKDVELVILDYKLKGAKKGDEIITDLRGKDFFEDVVFYTTGAVPNDVFTTPPDGVFFVARGDLKERVKDLVGLRIRRASDLATLRGWIVADAIEIECILGRVLCKCFGEMQETFRDRVLADEGIFDFGKKHRVVNGILKDRLAALRATDPGSAKISGLSACKSILDAFPEEIIELRNALAHQIAEMSDTGQKKVKTKTKKAQDIVVTPDQCVAIRKSVRKHVRNLLDLEALV